MKKTVKTFLEYLLQILLKIVYYPIPCKMDDGKELFLKQVCKVVQDKEHYVSYFLQLKNKTHSNKLIYTIEKLHFAIVLQGPIRVEDNFTFNTAMFYKENYPNAVVIVSTWNNEPEEEINRLKNAGIDVVLCHKPENCGHKNVNLQLITSYAGITRAQELGCEFTCKTRTDQRLDRSNIFEFFANLIKKFPTCQPTLQRGRIIFLGMNYGTLFIPYFMSDFLYFGYTEDMVKLMGVPLDERKNFKIGTDVTRYKLAESLDPPEIYILYKYLESIGCDNEISIKQYWEFVKNMSICVGRRDVDLVWPKYEDMYEKNTYYGDYSPKNNSIRLTTENFDFVTWFNLYSGTFLYKDEYEQRMTERFM